MSKVWVVTGFELGWDCVVAIFDSTQVTKEQLEERFDSEQYYIQRKTIETDMDDWKD